LLNLIKNLFRPQREFQGLFFSRPLVMLHSDDWGRVGVRDREGLEQLRAGGLRLGEHPYDLYTLETAEDVAALTALLGRHHDSTGRAPCVVTNFCSANLHFPAMRKAGFRQCQLLPLAQGLPGSWSRPGLFEAYKDSASRGLFYPGLHGTTHFCPLAVNNALAEGGERAALLRLLWSAETPYIYWRMPWIGYEYWNPTRPEAGFLPLEAQRSLVRQACDNLTALFAARPLSACAPGWRANRDTHRAWAEAGIRVVENGSDSGLRPPHVDHFGLLHLYRTIDLEPSQREMDIAKYLQIAEACFTRGYPLVVSIHSINFHSTLKDFRTPSLAALDLLLTALEAKYPELLYVHDEDLYKIVTRGAFDSRMAQVTVPVHLHECSSVISCQEVG